jgi:hypothetical protein
MHDHDHVHLHVYKRTRMIIVGYIQYVYTLCALHRMYISTHISANGSVSMGMRIKHVYAYTRMQSGTSNENGACIILCMHFGYEYREWEMYATMHTQYAFYISTMHTQYAFGWVCICNNHTKHNQSRPKLHTHIDLRLNILCECVYLSCKRCSSIG